MSDSRSSLRPVRAAILAALIAAGCAGPSLASAADEGDTAITIYSSAAPGAIPADLYRPIPGGGMPSPLSVPGYAMVRDERSIKLENGRSTIRFTDVAALIDPTTVTFASLTEPRTRVVEQNFQFDLVSTQKLLLKYIDKPITVERTVGNQSTTVSGTLLSALDGLVLKTNDGSIQTIPNYTSVRFPELPGGLNTRPTLVWDIQSPRAGDQRARVTYQTGGITWWADYNLIFNEGKDANSGLLDLAAWVSIINQSGATYPETKLKLIAGDVHRAEAPQPVPMMAKRAMDVAAAAEAPGFQEKAFSEFHLYTLGRRTTLPNNSTKQLELFDQAKQIPAKKVLVYYGLNMPYTYPSPMTDRNLGIESNKKVDVYLEFKNDKQYGLGVPLPAGRIRVSQLDTADGTLEFVGEDSIDHTPKDETVRVKLGSAFDVVGERKQTDFKVDTHAHWIEEAFEIKVRNHKAQPVEVLVKENLYRWSNWSVIEKSQDFTKEDVRTIHFPVKIGKDGEAVVKYRVRYTW